MFKMTYKKVIKENYQPKKGINVEVSKLTTLLERQTLLEENVIAKDYIIKHNLQRSFYYLRDKNKHPRITICLLRNPKTGVICRGTAICSIKETIINKSVGKMIAEIRAVNAFMVQKDSCDISREESYTIFNSIIPVDRDSHLFKSEYDIGQYLSNVEARIINRERKS